jgi:hypothetical protein
MMSVVIPDPTLSDARNLFESLTNEEGLEHWKDGVGNGIEKNNWCGLLAHRRA